jgi:pimeloyl-ACP methyl ester carboxylesterase
MNAADGLGLLQQPDLQQLCVTPHEFVMPGEGRNARTGVLLIHGLTGTPAEMRLLAKGLNKQGFTVYGVQLAGHCGSMEDLVAARWTDWLASVESGLQRFSLHVDHVVVGGLSMGALLSLAVAERHPDKVAGVCALSTTFRYDGWSIPAYTKLAFLLPLFRLLGIGRNSVFMEAPPYGIKDEALRARGRADEQRRQLCRRPARQSLVERHRAARPVRECAGRTGAAALALSGHSCPGRRYFLGQQCPRYPARRGQRPCRPGAAGQLLSHDHHRPRAPHRDCQAQRIHRAHRQLGGACQGCEWVVISRPWW